MDNTGDRTAYTVSIHSPSLKLCMFNPRCNIALTDFFSAVNVTWPSGTPFHIYFT